MPGPLDQLASRLIGGEPGENRPPQVAAARRVAVVMLLLSIVLRLGFAVLNLQANDDHIEVIQAMAFEDRVPIGTEMWEAFQPKLYHGTVATLLKLMPKRHLPTEIRIANLVSFLAGLVALLALVRFTHRLSVREQLRYQAIVLLALNPKFILISTQATNDSFVICFCVLALLAGQRWLSEYAWRDWAWMTLFAILAGLSKGNALVLPCAISLAAFLVVVAERSRQYARKPVVLGAVVFCLGFVGVVGMLGPYRGNLERYGTPFVTNIPRQPFPQLFERTYVMRPGVTSIADSFFTFRLIAMLRAPSLRGSAEEYPLWATSVPSMLYGRAHSIHFDYFPPELRSDAPLVRTVTRATLILALPLTVLMLMELMRWGVAALMLRSDRNDKSLLLAVACAGFIAFQVVYAIRYRDFSTIKTIFLMPALPGFVASFVYSVERFTNRFGESSPAGRVVQACLVWLPMLYLADLFSALASLALARLRGA